MLVETVGSGVASPRPASRATPRIAATSQASDIHTRRSGKRRARYMAARTTPALAMSASAPTTPRPETTTSAASMSWPAMSIMASMRTAPLLDEPAVRPVASESTTSVAHTRQISALGYWPTRNRRKLSVMTPQRAPNRAHCRKLQTT